MPTHMFKSKALPSSSSDGSAGSGGHTLFGGCSALTPEGVGWESGVTKIEGRIPALKELRLQIRLNTERALCPHS